MKKEVNDGLPLGYLITFRAHGTWLHGDARGSVDRFHNQFGSARIPYNQQWQRYNANSLKQSPVKLTGARRKLVKDAIREYVKFETGHSGRLTFEATTCTRSYPQRASLKKCGAR